MKCKEQNVPLCIVFIDLTKAFDLVSRVRLFSILSNIGFPPSLFNIVKSFHTNTKATVQYDGNVSESFTIKSGVNHGCVLAPTLFEIFFFMLLKRDFFPSTVGVKLYTRSDGRLLNHALLKAKSKLKYITVQDLLFADDAALVAQDMQTLLNKFSLVCLYFGLAISLKKLKC